MGTNKITKLVNDYAQAIHDQDREKFCSLWVNDGNDVLISITETFSGLESIFQDFLIGKIQARYSDIRLITEDIQIKPLSGDMAVVIFSYRTECRLRENGDTYGIQGLETQVVVKEGDDWKLRHVHYSK